MKRLGVVLACALVAFACNRASRETSTESSSTEASRSGAPQGPEAAPAPLVEADFEEEALRQINGDNLEAELGLIAQEVRKK